MTVTAVPSPKRTSEIIKQEFNNLAFRAGHLQYEILTKQRDLKMFNETLDGFEVEYKKVKQEEDAAAKAAASETPPVSDAPATESTG